jgi:membrane-bound lytic murein transglycosylase F
MGFTYEVMKDYADHLGVQLEMNVATSIDTSYNKLLTGNVDMLCLYLPVNLEKQKQIIFTSPILKAKPVLVQRKPDGWSTLATERLESRLIRKSSQLSGKTVFVEKGSPLVKLMTFLSFGARDSIRVFEHPELHTEQLITEVAKGNLPYTVAYDLTAKANQNYYPLIDFNTVLGGEQNLVWSMSRNSGDLQADFNKWFRKYKKTSHYSSLYDKYFEKPRNVHFASVVSFNLKKGKISPYDESIRKYSKLIDWDWRIIAAVIYYESKFHPDAQAWSGASGLMQLMPETLEMYGLDSLSSPEKHIEAGIKYLGSIEKQFMDKIPDKAERQKFVLASYNVGIGHVFDARRLAEKYKKNNKVWSGNVDSFLLRKSRPKYYQDRLAFYGYCRGEEPFNFVNDVIAMYELYKKAIRN